MAQHAIPPDRQEQLWPLPLPPMPARRCEACRLAFCGAAVKLLRARDGIFAPRALTVRGILGLAACAVLIAFASPIGAEVAPSTPDHATPAGRSEAASPEATAAAGPIPCAPDVPAVPYQYASERRDAGVRPDADGDGFHDEIDECPNEPEARDGIEDDDGCPDRRHGRTPPPVVTPPGPLADPATLPPSQPTPEWRADPGAIATGLVFAALAVPLVAWGALSALGSGFGADRSDHAADRMRAGGIAMAATGALALAGGIALIVVGAQNKPRVPAADESGAPDRAAPVRAELTAAGLTVVW